MSTDDPLDPRALLDTWRAGYEDARARVRAYQDEFPVVIDLCLKAGIEKKEIASRAGMSRTTVHHYQSNQEKAGNDDGENS